MNKEFWDNFVSMNSEAATWSSNIKWKNGKLHHIKYGTLKCTRAVGKFKIFARKLNLSYYAVDYFVVNTVTGEIFQTWSIYLTPILDKIIHWLTNDVNTDNAITLTSA